MKCPRCVQKIHRGAESCPHCGFCLGTADGEFGTEEVVVRALTDAAGLLRKQDRHTVQKAMDRFSRRFPQLFFGVYTGVFRESANLRQFGFWLLNRGAFEDVDLQRPNAAGIILVIDVEGKAAGLTYGYLLDPYLDEDETFFCLTKAHPYWLERRTADGIVALLRALENILKRKSRQVKRDPERFERKVFPPPQMGGLVKKIRSGHSRSERQDAGKEVGL
ncbi:MAG: hypothetical protein KGQ89_04355 [Verrucomicrobia bacterium]|nr:hypothetical protein [Verrucomicrobiota bacterium]